MRTTLLKYIGLPTVITASACAFYYLNTVQLPEVSSFPKTIKEESQQKKRTILLTDPKTNKKQLIIIDPPKAKWDDSSSASFHKEPAEAQDDSRGSGLPDVEFLKFVIQKGREGIPVLSIGNYLHFL